MTAAAEDPCAGHKHPPCLDCSRPLRARRDSETDHPGTVQARRKGRCNPCGYANQKGETPAPQRNIQATIASLDAYMARRRKRGIPTTGLRRNTA